MKDFEFARSSLGDISDLDLAFGTTRFLPPFEQVPEAFKRGNDYTKLIEHLFAGGPVPDGEIEFRAAFDDPEAPALLNRLVMAHLRSHEPKQEHKIAGMGYLVSIVCTVRLHGG